MPTLSPSPSENVAWTPSRPVTCSRAVPLSCPATSQERHVRPSRTGAGPKTMSYSVPLYVLRPSHGPNPNRHRPRGRALHCVRMRPPPPHTQKTSRRPKLNSCRRKTRSQDRAMPSVRLRPENVTPAPAERSPVPRPCHALFSSTSRERHVGPSRTVVGPKTVPCSIPVYVPRTSRRPKPNSRRSQYRAMLYSRLRPKNVTSAQAEQSPVPRPCRALSCLRPKNVTSAQAGQSPVPRPCPALFPSTSRERHVGPSRAVASPKTVPSSIPVYVPRTSRRPKPNSRRSQDRAMLYSRLRPKNVTSAQAEQSPVPRPCRALFPSTSQERHVGPSRTVAGPKTVSCSVPVYVPRTSRRPKPKVVGPKTVSRSVPVYVPRPSRRPKPNSRRSQDHAMLYSRLRPENVTSAQAEQSPVPRPCHTLFPSTSRERHVGPSRTVADPKTVSCSVPVYVPRTSRRPKPNSRRSQDRVVLCSCLRPKNVTSAQAEQSPVPRPCRALFLSTSQERHVGPSRTVVGPKTMSCSVPVYVPRTSRRPKPNSRRSQDHVVLCSCLRPKTVTSAQVEHSSVPRPCHALFPSTSRERHVGPSRTVAGPKTVSCSVPVYVQERHVGPSRTVAGPKTVSCSVPVYVPRTSRRPKPNSRRSQDHVVLCSCLRPKNVTSAQAEQSSVPRPCRALFLSTSQDRHVGPSRTVVGPKTVPCSIPVYVPRTSRRPKPNSHRSQDRAILYSRRRPENVTSAQAEQSLVPRPCRVLFPSTSRERPPHSHRSQDSALLCFRLRPENVTRERHVGPAEQSPVLSPVVLRFRLRPKNVTSAQAE